MPDMEILIQMIIKTARVELQIEYGRELVTLHEPQAPDSFATIRNLPSDTLVIKVDAFKSPDDIFSGSNNECKRADYVIISLEKKCILYIELKRTKDNWEQIVKQLIGAKCFVKYCQEIGKSFWNEKNFLDGYEHRFISIGHTSIAKRKTRITRNSSIHDSPDKALRVDWPHYLQFNHLAGS